MRGISWLDELLLASQKGFCSKELVSSLRALPAVGCRAAVQFASPPAILGFIPSTQLRNSDITNYFISWGDDEIQEDHNDDGGDSKEEDSPAEMMMAMIMTQCYVTKQSNITGRIRCQSCLTSFVAAFRKAPTGVVVSAGRRSWCLPPLCGETHRIVWRFVAVTPASATDVNIGCCL